MWLLVVALGLAVIVAHGVYFSGRLSRAVAAVTAVSPRALRRARIGYLLVASSLPAAIVCYAVYALIARPGAGRLPSSAVLDYLVVFPFWITTIWSAQATLLTAPIDLVHLALRAAGRATDARWHRRRHAAALAIAGVLAIYVPVALALAAARLDVRHHRYAAPDVPAELDGYRIVLVADLQADRYTDRARLDELVDAVNRQDPDLVLIAGDMITRGPDHIEAAAEAAGRMRARDGVYACVGDHDNWAYRDRARSVAAITAALARHGVTMIDNDTRTIQVGDATLGIAFATNSYVQRIDPGTTRRLLDQVAAADLQLVLAHQTGPRLLADARDRGVELFLGGHTHGGQIRFWTPLGDLFVILFETPYVSGAYRLGDMLLVVTNGLGVSVAPFRYRAPASIEVIELARP